MINKHDESDDCRASNNINKFDELIYGIVNERFKLEWETSDTLDNKANAIIGFIGIFISLETWLLNLFTETFKKINLNSILLLSFAVLFILLIGALLFCLKAYRVQGWKLAPECHNLLTDCANGKDPEEILRMLTSEIANSIDHNKGINRQKAYLINNAIVFLVLAIITNIILIYITIWSMLQK